MKRKAKSILSFPEYKRKQIMRTRKQIGQLLRDVRKYLKVTQSDLGNQLKISAATIGQYETATLGICDYTAEQIAQIVPIDAIALKGGHYSSKIIGNKELENASAMARDKAYREMGELNAKEGNNGRPFKEKMKATTRDGLELKNSHPSPLDTLWIYETLSESPKWENELQELAKREGISYSVYCGGLGALVKQKVIEKREFSTTKKYFWAVSGTIVRMRQNGKLFYYSEKLKGVYSAKSISEGNPEPAQKIITKEPEPQAKNEVKQALLELFDWSESRDKWKDYRASYVDDLIEYKIQRIADPVECALALASLGYEFNNSYHTKKRINGLIHYTLPSPLVRLVPKNPKNAVPVREISTTTDKRKRIEECYSRLNEMEVEKKAVNRIRELAVSGALRKEDMPAKHMEITVEDWEIFISLVARYFIRCEKETKEIGNQINSIIEE